MAIAHQGTGTRGAGTTTTTPTLSGGAAGRIALAGRTVKPSTATAATETGWAQQVNVTGGTGSQGIDTGPQRLAIDTKILVGSDANPTFDQGSTPNATSSIATIYSAGTGKLIHTQFSNGDDAVHDTGRSATSATVSLEVGDVIWAYLASDTDATTAWTSPTISVSAGAVGSTTERLAPGGSATGQDVGNSAYEATVTTAAASATITFSATGGANNCGAVGFAVLRESSMTYTAELAATTAETFGTGSHTTASFTPEANSLLVVAVSAGVSASGTDILANLTITDSAGLTYTSRATVQDNSTTGVSSYATRIYTAPVGGSPAAMTLTFDCGAVSVFAYHYSVVSITGYDTGTPTGATGSVANTGTGALSLTLGAAPAATSFIYGYSFNDVNTSGTTNTLPGAMFTEIHEAATSTPNQWIQAQIATGRTSTTVDWVDTDAGTATTFFRTAVALEIKQGAPSGDATVTPGVIARSFTVPQSAVSVASTPAAITRSFTTPIQTVSVAAAPAAVTRSFTTPAQTVSVEATPGVVARSFTIPQVSASESTIVTPTAIARAFTLPAATVSIGVLPAAVSQAFTIQSVAVSVASAPAAIVQAFIVPQVTVDGGAAGDATVTPAAIARAFAIHQPAISAAATPAVMVLAATAPAATLNVGASPAAITRAFTIPATAMSIGASPAVLAAAVAFPEFFVLTDNIPIPAGVPLFADSNNTLTASSSRFTTGGRPHDVTVPAGNHVVEA